eukprot:3665378-Amphidinium_carterae.1
MARARAVAYQQLHHRLLIVRTRFSGNSNLMRPGTLPKFCSQTTHNNTTISACQLRCRVSKKSNNRRRNERPKDDNFTKERKIGG